PCGEWAYSVFPSESCRCAKVSCAARTLVPIKLGTAYRRDPSDKRTLTLRSTFRRVRLDGICSNTRPSATSELKRELDTFSLKPRFFRMSSASSFVLPATSGTSTSRPLIANRIAVKALTTPATARIATIKMMLDHRENWFCKLFSDSRTSDGVSAISVIILHGFKFFTSLHPHSVREIDARHGFSILRLNRKDLEWNSIATHHGEP